MMVLKRMINSKDQECSMLHMAKVCELLVVLSLHAPFIVKSNHSCLQWFINTFLEVLAQVSIKIYHSSTSADDDDNEKTPQ